MPSPEPALPIPALPNGEPTPPIRAHIAHLDGLRGLAALVVVLHHIALTAWNSAERLSGIALLAAEPFRLTGHYAVGLFIVLSGYSLLVSQVDRETGELRVSPGAFILRRARRILPPYYAALALSLIACWTILGQKTGTHWDASIPVTPQGILTHLFLVQDLCDWTQINHALWSISVEWRIYFLFPFLVLAFRRRGAVFVSIVMLAGSIAFYFLVQRFLPKPLFLSHDIVAVAVPAYFSLFVWGMLAHELARGRLKAWGERICWPFVTVLAFLAWAGLLLYWRNDMSPNKLFILDLLTGVLSLGLLVTASRPGRAQRFLSARPVAFLGTFAYSIYLIHAPLVQIAYQYGVSRLHLSPLTAFGMMLCLGLPGILGVCYLFYLAFERPTVKKPVPAR